MSILVGVTVIMPQLAGHFDVRFSSKKKPDRYLAVRLSKEEGDEG